MTGQRDEMAGVIRSVTDTWDEPLDEVHDAPQIVNALLAAGFGPVRAVEAERDAALDRYAEREQRWHWNLIREQNAITRAESAEAALAGLRTVLDEYFDFGADPWEDHDAACPAPEDIWRLHRDLRALLASTPDREEES